MRIKSLFQKIDLKVIAQNAEKYMAFYLGKHLVFLDSLAKNLPRDKFTYIKMELEKRKGLENRFPNRVYEDEDGVGMRDMFELQEFELQEFKMITRNGVYPYDYMDCFDKLKEKKLPCKEDFYSLLTDEDISDDDYNHAKDVWNTFYIKNMGEYHDLYLKTDVLILADVFEILEKLLW